MHAWEISMRWWNVTYIGALHHQPFPTVQTSHFWHIMCVRDPVIVAPIFSKRSHTTECVMAFHTIWHTLRCVDVTSFLLGTKWTPAACDRMRWDCATEWGKCIFSFEKQLRTRDRRTKNWSLPSEIGLPTKLSTRTLSHVPLKNSALAYLGHSTVLILAFTPNKLKVQKLCVGHFYVCFSLFSKLNVSFGKLTFSGKHFCIGAYTTVLYKGNLNKHCSYYYFSLLVVYSASWWTHGLCSTRRVLFLSLT